MDRLRIVSTGTNPALCKECAERFRIGRPDNEEMPRWLTRGCNRRQDEVSDAFQFLEIDLCNGFALSVPSGEQRQLVEQDDRLDRVETRSVPLEVVMVLPLLTVFAECADMCRDVVVIRRQ